MKKNRTWLILFLVVVFLFVYKFFFLNKEESKGGKSSKPNHSAPILVKYYVAKLSTYNNSVLTTGKIGAYNMVEITPEVSGKVMGIFFKEGETVEKGKLLVKLNDADLQAQLSKNKVNQKLAEQKLARLKKLLEAKGASQEEYEIQENELMTLKADESFYLAQIAKTTIVAPFSGVIGLKNISEGSFVNPSNPVVSLVQLNPLFIEFSVSDKYANFLKRGMSVAFNSSGDETSHEASVFAIEPKVNETTKTILMRAEYNGKKRFYPGAFVNVTINLASNDTNITVPTQCVIPILKGQKVFLVKNGIAKEQLVKIGSRSDQKIQITEGVQSGDTIVATGLLSMKNESLIKLIAPIN